MSEVKAPFVGRASAIIINHKEMNSSLVDGFVRNFMNKLVSN